MVGSDFRNAPFVCPPSFVSRWGLLALGGIADGFTAAALTKRLAMSAKDYFFLLLGDLKLLCHGLLRWFSWLTGSPDMLVVRWCMRKMQSYSGTKLQYDVT